MRAKLRRQAVALVTAYAVALQALLPALALAVSASGDQLRSSVEICATAINTSDGTPRERHDRCTHGLTCPAGGCSGLAALLSPALLQLGPEFSPPTAVLHPVERAASQVGLPHSARAPPQA